MSRRKAVKPAEVAGEGVDWLQADFTGNISAEYIRLFAVALNKEMDRQDLGVRELGRIAGISHSTVLGILTGKNVPDLDTVALLAKALGKELLPPRRLHK